MPDAPPDAWTRAGDNAASRTRAIVGLRDLDEIEAVRRDKTLDAGERASLTVQARLLRRLARLSDRVKLTDLLMEAEVQARPGVRAAATTRLRALEG